MLFSFSIGKYVTEDSQIHITYKGNSTWMSIKSFEKIIEKSIRKSGDYFSTNNYLDYFGKSSWELVDVTIDGSRIMDINADTNYTEEYYFKRLLNR